MLYIFLIPIHICFDVPFENLILDLDNIAPIIFIIDIIINLDTGFYDRGLPVLKKTKIIKHYF